jgi:aryl-alcohol dehydrogenase-like predicted oxidoreductase
VEYRKLGDLQVSAIGMGTLRTFDVTSGEEIAQRREIIDNCLANQINFIDTAAWYGNAEKVVGITTEGNRDKFYLATKVRIEGKEAGEAQIARSFQLLNTDYIDLFQVHNLVDWETQLPTLQRLKDQGKVGMVGVTAMVHEAYPIIADLMRSGRVDAIQIPYNVMERGCEEELLPLAEEHEVGVLVMEPLKKGRYVKELKSQPDITPLKEFGVDTWAQALLAWVLSEPRVTLTIPATSRPERIQENAAAGSVGKLPQELRDYIRKETERCL